MKAYFHRINNRSILYAERLMFRKKYKHERIEVINDDLKIFLYLIIRIQYKNLYDESISYRLKNKRQ